MDSYKVMICGMIFAIIVEIVAVATVGMRLLLAGPAVYCATIVMVSAYVALRTADEGYLVVALLFTTILLMMLASFFEGIPVLSMVPILIFFVVGMVAILARTKISFLLRPRPKNSGA